jgi:hypothetical protein
MLDLLQQRAKWQELAIAIELATATAIGGFDVDDDRSH